MKKLHVILLKKNLTTIDNSCKETWISSNYMHWIALGHFDDIYTYQIDDSSNFLSCIQKDKMRVSKYNDDASYYHPLYLIPHKINQISQNENQWFIAIVRIHLLQSTEIATQFNETCNFINQALKNQNMPYQIYYATEFSDMVLEIRSNRLDHLLKFVLSIRESNQSNIGKTYTYFGINSHLLSSSENVPEIDDIIPLFSMRFSGYNIDITKKQIELIRKHLSLERDVEPLEYCINGIDDIMLIFKNRYTSSIIELYRDWLFNDSYKDIRKSESSTRVGIEINIETTILHDIPSDYKSEENKLCADLPNLCKKISDLISVRNDKPYFGWFYAISQIANSLVRMSKTPIMDEVVYLVAPGVRSFLLNVLDLLNHNPTGYYSYYSYLYEYVESCSYYIEQLVRVEGQLSHNPEIRPVIYDIPVFMLEYTIAFLNKVAKLLRKNDELGYKKNTVFLLVPRPCERASATELFPATHNFPGVVHIQIPESILYTPTEVFRSLCHEISHYVGESYRNRYARKSAYIHAISSLVVNIIFNSNDELFLEMIKSVFAKNLEKYEYPTIRDMHAEIMVVLKSMFSEEKCMDRILRQYIDFTTSQNKLPSRIEFLTDDELGFIFEKDFENHVYDIDILFREVFADICMLYVLGLDSENYIDSLLYELEMYPEPNNISEDVFAIRIYVTLTAMHKNINYNGKYHIVWNNINNRILEISDEINSETNGKYQFPIPSNSIYALLKYAEKCFQTISKSLSETDVYDVRYMYTKLIDNDFRYQDILGEIEKCRKDMIKQYDE